jgi:PKD repeat protein
MKRVKKEKFRVIRILLIVFLLHCCVMAVSAKPIGYGETVTGNITTPGLDDYTFTAIAGDTIYTRLHSSWIDGPHIQLVAPNGTIIASSEGSIDRYTTEITKLLPSTGTYTLLAGDYTGDNTGTYGLYLQRTNNPGHAVPLAFGETKTESITQVAQMNNYTFPATAGDTIYTRMHSSWIDGSQIRLYAPNGTMLASSGGSIDRYTTEITKILPSTGTYTLLVGDYTGDNTGTYGLTLKFYGSLAVTANFSASPTSGTIPLAVKFTDESSNEPYAWIWDFGDGNTSSLQNPSNTYANVGHYSVNLTATNTYGSNTTLKPKYITATYAVIPLPGYTLPPTDPDDDFIFEDLNGNGRLDFADVVLYFNQMEWIAAHEPVGAFDLNGNGRIDFADIVKLFSEI